MNWKFMLTLFGVTVVALGLYDYVVGPAIAGTATAPQTTPPVVGD
jgi:hypothetical protein